MPTQGRTSLVDILQWRAEMQPNRLAYRFLINGASEEVVLSYQDLDERARSIAALLQSFLKAGDRALLLFPFGPDFIAAYFGCLYAQIIAIPACPPHPSRYELMLPSLLNIVADAAPAAVLCNLSLFYVINAQEAVSGAFDNMKLLVTDDPQIVDRKEQWQKPHIAHYDIAFLQYTSGSTTTPRGVIISHGNLLHNLGLIEQCFGQSSESHAVIWLPPYHDMGLIGGILQPLYSGYPVTLIPHLLFLQQPFRWLQAISQFKATTSGAPNFAYDLCTKKIKPEQRDLLDLSSWTVAFNGAEQVYYKTLDRFAEYFAPCGFRRESFLPCYGMAEATLMVTGGPSGRSPVMQQVQRSWLEQNQAIIAPDKTEETRTLVSCGQNMSDQEIRIVDPETLSPCSDNEVGEIWIRGRSVARGYWNKPLETACTFGARLSDGQPGSFLRTGDLGFLHQGELYITGRLKNLIISNGKNHDPQDIEKTVEVCHWAVRASGCAVFSIDKPGGEGIIVIIEIEHRLMVKAAEVAAAVRKAVAIHHDLHVDDIKLTKPGGIPRTTSGKIRHFLCKKNYLAGTLTEITLI